MTGQRTGNAFSTAASVWPESTMSSTSSTRDPSRGEVIVMCSAMTSSPRTVPHSAARDADDLVEVVARLVDLERQLFHERVVLVPAHMQAWHPISPRARLS